jgi:branched-chain amino acid aminotransferase
VSVLLERLSRADGTRLPHLDLRDRGLTLGDGVFDTLTLAKGRSPRLERHLQRLSDAAALIAIPVDPDRLEQMVRDAMAEIGGAAAILRTTITRGPAGRGLWPATAPEPTVLITAEPWSETLIGQPASLVIARTALNHHSPLPRIKVLGYLDKILAAREAAEAGADDSLILNLEERVASSTIANLFALVGRTLITPPPSEGCLDGVMRGIVLDMAPTLGLEPVEKPLAPSDLLRADAVFLTNSVRLLRPVIGLAGETVATSAVTCTLLARLRALFEPGTEAP